MSATLREANGASQSLPPISVALRFFEENAGMHPGRPPVTDIFDFWSRIGAADHIHPADHDSLRQNPNHGFDFRGLPGCFMGPLRTAPVVLLYLSPGGDNGADANSKINQKRQERMRGGKEPLPSPADNADTFGWWTQRTRCFGEAWNFLRSQVAFLNIGAYHAKGVSDRAFLLKLPSSRVTLDWAKHTLFPQALSGERVVVCMRSRLLWNLTAGRTGKSLFAPATNRGGHMLHGPMREEVVAAVRSRLATAR